jgi:hypothetical protein
VAGIDYSTFRKWMIRGEKAEGITDSEFVDFFEAVTRAIALTKADLIKVIYSAAQVDWRAARDLLRMRLPEQSRRAVTFGATGTVNGAVFILDYGEDA